MFKKTLLSAAALLAAGTLSASVFAAPTTVEGTGVGKHGDITGAVTFDAGKIQDIKIVKNAENPILAKKVFTDLKDQVVAFSSTDVDLVSGATFSAKGFIDAVNDAAKKAGVTLAKADKKALKKAARELPKTSNYDVVVIGAGGAGFSAAITAKNAGANVVLLEKMPAVGGNSLISGAEMNVAKNWVQPKLGINDDSPELHAQDTFKGGDGKGDMKVINVMTHEALDAAKWCRDYLGVRFEDDNLFFFGGHSRKRALIPVGHTGTEFIAKFQAKADELGIPVITNMKAEELIKNKDGRVVGVKATMDGSEYTFNAKGGVVLATGGFPHNRAMLEKLVPDYAPYADLSVASIGDTGDGISMAVRAGAAPYTDAWVIGLYLNSEKKELNGVITSKDKYKDRVFVNEKGLRFTNENLPYLTDAVVKEKAVWGIADSSDPEKVKAALKYNDPKYAVRGDTWEALAATMGVPPDALARTMKDYNAACTTGDDKAFGKAKEFLKPFAKPPFFAVRVVPKTGGTNGGVKVNDKFQVVREDGSVIKGLYAGGEVINRPYYNRVYTSGTGLGIAYTSGRIAGTNAAAER